MVAVIFRRRADSVRTVEEYVSGEVGKVKSNRNRFNLGTVWEQNVAVSRVGSSICARHGESVVR